MRLETRVTSGTRSRSHCGGGALRKVPSKMSPAAQVLLDLKSVLRKLPWDPPVTPRLQLQVPLGKLLIISSPTSFYALKHFP